MRSQQVWETQSVCECLRREGSAARQPQRLPRPAAPCFAAWMSPVWWSPPAPMWCRGSISDHCRCWELKATERKALTFCHGDDRTKWPAINNSLSRIIWCIESLSFSRRWTSLGMWDKETAITSLNRVWLCETKKKEPFCECRRNNPHALFYFFLSPFSSNQLLRGFVCRSYTLQTKTINVSNQFLVILFYHCCIATAKQNKKLKPNKNQQAYTKPSFHPPSSSNQIYKSSFLTAAYVFKSV